MNVLRLYALCSINGMFKQSGTLLGTRTEEALEARRGAQALDAGQAHRSIRKSLSATLCSGYPGCVFRSC